MNGMTRIMARRNMKKREKDNKGFSLIELIIVITIMAILTALLAPQLLRYVEQSRQSKDAANMDELYRATQLALTDEKVYAAVSNGQKIVYGATGGITFDPANTTLSDELAKTLGTLSSTPSLASSLYKTSDRTVTINVSTDNIATVSYTHPK